MGLIVVDGLVVVVVMVVVVAVMIVVVVVVVVVMIVVVVDDFLRRMGFPKIICAISFTADSLLMPFVPLTDTGF